MTLDQVIEANRDRYYRALKAHDFELYRKCAAKKRADKHKLEYSRIMNRALHRDKYAALTGGPQP